MVVKLKYDEVGDQNGWKLIVHKAFSYFVSEYEFIMSLVLMLYIKNIFLYFLVLINYKIMKRRKYFELNET